jgi:hypothetical protein
MAIMKEQFLQTERYNLGLLSAYVPRVQTLDSSQMSLKPLAGKRLHEILTERYLRARTQWGFIWKPSKHK